MTSFVIGGIVTYALICCYKLANKLRIDVPRKEQDKEDCINLDVKLPEGFTASCYYTHKYEKYMTCIRNKEGKEYWLGTYSKEEAERQALNVCIKNKNLEY